MTVWTIKAEFDPEAAVWFSIAGDLPGLMIDGATFDVLAAKAGRILPDLLEIHREDLEPRQLVGPHIIRIVAHHEHDFRVAA